MKKLWLLAVSAAVGTAALLMPSCSSGPRDLCADNQVTCDSANTCDPTDGLCKCGGRGGVVCPDGFACDTGSNTCVSHKCDNVTCANQTSCDVNDGKCKCGGTGGLTCGDNQQCDPVAKKCQAPVDCRQVACPANQTCDPTTGACLCGAAACPAGQFCSVAADSSKTCVASNCTGVACVGTSSCDPNDGVCKCNGQVCAAGDSCQCPAGADAGSCAETARVCRPSSACTGVSCSGGTNCDPADGQCKCGGPGGPVCGAGQLCALGPPPQCQGGNQCQLADGGTRNCSGGTSCDPEDGQCKCGGRGGQICAAANPSTQDPGEVCVAHSSSNACKRPCNPVNSDCPNGTYCYFDSAAVTPTSYCSAPTGSQAEGTACQNATACFSQSPAPHALDCVGLAQGQFGLCRAYCDRVTGDASCVQIPRHTCEAIANAPSNVGYCAP